MAADRGLAGVPVNLGMRPRGFTLIELLVVIAIIAILAALLFPVFQRAKAAAGDSVSISNSKQLGLGFQLYLDDNDDVYPQAPDGTPGIGLNGGWIFYSVFGNTEAGTFDSTKGSIYPYVNSKPLYQSKADKDAVKSGDSFAMNGYLTVWSGTGMNTSKSATTVDSPSSTMLLGEEGTGEPQLLSYGYVNGTNDGYFNPPTDHFGKFHPGGTVILYCDGHSKISQAEDHMIMTICGSPVLCYH